MASGKARGFKRSSATSSYSSATKIVLFVGLSVLGLWVLTSNSFAPHQSTTATRTPDQIISISRSHHPMPGGVHDDAIKSDDRGRSDDVIESLEMVDHERDSSADSSENADEKGTEQNDEQETKLENDGSEDGSGIKIDEKIDDQGGGEDHEDVKESKDEGQEKQTVLGTQNSEESSVTQKEEIERTAEENQTNDSQSTQNYEDGSEADGSEIAENQITDEDQQRRIDEHQQLEDEQIQQGAQEGQEKNPHGAISDNQIQHDEVPLQSPETGNNAQVKIQDIKHDSVKEVEKMNQETLSNRNDDASFSNGHSLGTPKESAESKKSWSTQAHQSQNQKERRKAGSDDKDRSDYGYIWLLCNVTAGADYIPCLDNEKAVKKLPNRKHDEHRERHCPAEPPTCLVPLPQGYKRRIDWPQSRDKIWYNNVPHIASRSQGASELGEGNREFLTFPGGGTQFIHGAMHYINFIQEAVPDIAWGKHSRVVLDIGCGVASFGGYLFDKNVLTMSFAPKDEHEAQVQFALERGIPAISAVMGSQRLPFPSRVYDMVHCARCRVPWHADGGSLLLELNRVLRPGGYFVWSQLQCIKSMKKTCRYGKLVTIKKDKMNSIGAAIYQKPDSNDCYQRRKQNVPPMCKHDDDPNAAWYVPLQSCMHQVPIQENERGSQWPEEWPDRLQTPPYWLNKSQIGIYGKPAPDDFASDYEYWKKVVSTTYKNDLGVSWSNVRNVMDLRAVYGGFAAALKDDSIWVMNVVNVDSADTLPIIYERGLFGIYHDWCESFSTYPRTYDLLHADHLFSKVKERCKLEIVMAEVDRIVRPWGKLITRDESSTTEEVEKLLKSQHWEILSHDQEGMLSAQKSDWRPTAYAEPS